jgi:hypothetical protein
MSNLPHILADSEDVPVKLIIFLIVLVWWGISALAKMIKGSSAAQKERLRQVREAIERSQQTGRSQQTARQQPQQYAPAKRPPVQLAPGVARRVPPLVRPKQRRASARVPVPTGPRPATNYNAMAQAKPRPAQAPPPLPAQAPAQVQTKFAAQSAPSAPISTSRRPATVGALAINKWLKPATLRQQFILTELFQPPLALRERKD